MTLFATSEDAIAIAYDTHGAGEPAVVLVHGWCCNRSYWAAQMRAIGPSNLVLAPDLAGHGASGTSRAEWTMAAYGADVAAVVRHAGVAQCILVGHSMGADVVLEAARVLPGIVLGMIWIDEYTHLPILRSEADVATRIASFSANFQSATLNFVRAMFPSHAAPDLVSRVSNSMAAASPNIAIPSLEATWNHGRRVPSLLEEVGLPVLAINTSGSPDDDVSLTRHGVQVVRMPGVGHFPMLEQPVQFNLLLMQAINHLARPRSGA